MYRHKGERMWWEDCDIVPKPRSAGITVSKCSDRCPHFSYEWMNTEDFEPYITGEHCEHLGEEVDIAMHPYSDQRKARGFPDDCPLK